MANYRFNNMKQVKNGIDIYIKKILNDISKDVFYELRQNVEEEVYSWTPARYERTNDVLNSISRTAVLPHGKGYKVCVYFDSDKIEAEYRMPGGWNAHASFSGNEIDGDTLIGWLEYGTDNKFYSHLSYGFFKETLNWLENEMYSMVRVKLIKYGLNV